jgi:hypothetical protein
VSSTLPVSDLSEVLARFLTLGGAYVALRQDFDKEVRRYDSAGRVVRTPAAGWPVYSWHCQGCHVQRDGKRYGAIPGDGFEKVRDGANDHAAACRSVPQPRA